MRKINFIIVLILLALLGIAQNFEKRFTEAFKLFEVWLDDQRDFEKLPDITKIVVEDHSKETPVNFDLKDYFGYYDR